MKPPFFSDLEAVAFPLTVKGRTYTHPYLMDRFCVEFRAQNGDVINLLFSYGVGIAEIIANGKMVESSKWHSYLDTEHIEPASLRVEVERACADLFAAAHK